MIKKRYMMLLEILIAIMLIALCALPLIVPHIVMIQEEQKHEAALKMDHAVHLLYVDLLEQMHKNRITFAQVQDEKAIPIDDDTYKRIGVPPIPYKGYFKFSNRKEKPKKLQEWHANLVTVTFYFMPQDSAENQRPLFEFPYQIAFLRHNKNIQTPPEQPQQPRPTPTKTNRTTGKK